MSFFVKASKPEDWQNRLAASKQWKKGHSAKALAYCWMEAEGFPRFVRSVFQRSDYSIFRNIEFLAGFVEHEVPLPGGIRPSQSDILVLAKNDKYMVVIAVEGKVSEPFGETVEDWRKEETVGQKARLTFISDLFKLNKNNLQKIRYQLLHRTASALIEAKRFNASTALMMVHSFSPNHKWFEDYANFASLFGVDAQLNTIHFAKRTNGVNLYIAWITGDKIYLTK